METVYIPTESDFKRWVREAIEESITGHVIGSAGVTEQGVDLMNRKEVAKMLRISLVTLTDWMKKGLPFYKQRGRVYFSQKEILDHLKQTGAAQRKAVKDFLK